MDPTDASDVLDHLYDAVYVTDVNRCITYWNQAAEALTGYGASEIVHRNCGDSLLNHCDRDGRCLCHGSCPLAKTLQDGQPREASVYLRHRAGHRVPVRVRVAPLYDPDGAISGAVEVFNDDSSRLNHLQRVRDMATQAVLDTVTGLPNRRYLEQRLQARLDELGRQRTPVNVFVAEVDNVQELQLQYGAGAAERALRIIGQTLGSAAWTIDAVGRWDGATFLGILSPSSSQSLTSTGERLVALCREAALPLDNDEWRHLSVSVGIAEADPLDDVLRLVSKALQALQDARHEGAGKLVVHSEIPGLAVEA